MSRTVSAGARAVAAAAAAVVAIGELRTNKCARANRNNNNNKTNCQSETAARKRQQRSAQISAANYRMDNCVRSRALLGGRLSSEWSSEKRSKSRAKQKKLPSQTESTGSKGPSFSAARCAAAAALFALAIAAILVLFTTSSLIISEAIVPVGALTKASPRWSPATAVAQQQRANKLRSSAQSGLQLNSERPQRRRRRHNTSHNLQAKRPSDEPPTEQPFWRPRAPRTAVSGLAKALARAQANSRAAASARTNVAAVAAAPLLLPLAQPSIRQQRQTSTTATTTTTTATTGSNSNSSNKCALILQRTYVRKLTSSNSNTNSNDIDHDEAPELVSGLGGSAATGVEPTGRIERLCVRFSDVNAAIAEAKRRRQFRTSQALEEAVQSIEPAPPLIAQLGELNQETTKILAERFDLSPDEILNGLPLIDMARTDFWPLCPLMVRPIECDPSGRFRSFTGHCNNLRRPSWGAAQTPFVRFLAPRHPDGIEQERASVLDGSPLPAPRLVTSLVHRDHDAPSSDLSLLIMVWGQIIDHDVALAAPPRTETGLDFNCCKQPKRHPNCKPIEIPDGDPLYSRFGQKCMDFKRSLAGLRPNCALGPRVHINTITSTLDGNTIYGSTREVADQLRLFRGGLLKVQDSFAAEGLKPLMPKQLQRPDLDCFERPTASTYCFLGGDERVNEQPTLTAMHTVYVRDHNRLATKLAQLNAHWDDERLYHETRHLQAALIQHVLVTEYLPMLIGQDMLQAYNLSSKTAGYWSGYQPDVTPAISHGFSTAAFRQGHTFIQGRVQLWDSQTHSFLDSIQLRQLFKRPWHYYQAGRMDQVLAGIVNTPAQTYDPFITEEISGFLFIEPGESFGMDLPAINLARGREQGTPGYTAFRHWCGLSKVRSFADLVPLMSNRTAWQYARLYKHVDDIDLWSAGVSERRMPGAQIGPTFACIIARQFANIKRGDRFWYEAGGFASSFTLDQLREIKKATQARLICKNSDRMHMIQRQALKLPHPVFNPRVPCDQIPDVNLKYWREDPANLGSFFSSS